MTGAVRRRSRRSRPLTPTARVRRLRRRITLLFALTSAVGLVAMAAWAVRGDDVRWRDQLDRTMSADTNWALGLLETDEDGRLDAGVLLDTAGTACPPLHLLSVPPDAARDARRIAPADLVVEHAPRRPCLTVDGPAVRRAAAAAVNADEERSLDGRTTTGEPVRLFALPFYPPEAEEDSRPQGALVTVADTAAQQADHRRLAWRVTGGCALLVCLSALVGHLLSGRAVRPALEALDRQESFLADAAHDLRTPAASLRTLAETALRGDTDSTDVHRRTLRLAEGMGSLVDGLLTRARLMSGTAVLAVEPLRLDQLVEAVVEDAPTDGHRVTVEAREAVVVADPDLVRRAVANLVGNALVHGHAPGAPAEVEVTVAVDGASTTVTVEDTGPGLPPEVAGALFDRFRSGSRSTGLGLSIASWVAHAHGGSLTAGPGRRGGARFVLRLPSGDRPSAEG
ncbi:MULTISPECIES: sensor histidine kinase [Streptomyces]|uniref:sensor histidine kinase n=1 Tax=Streptomyces TaxID=1883 RepID=UPI0004CB36BD|nr:MULTISPECIES: HAMP domain-containing sensor histidine kinase [Streptomyces]RUP65735.1 Sensor protein KdpD [Streptomyces sp. NP10]WST51838.1 HAMP domain-containing histidine kinase [Streptomyces rubiginosohelvolus]